MAPLQARIHVKADLDLSGFTHLCCGLADRPKQVDGLNTRGAIAGPSAGCILLLEQAQMAEVKAGGEREACMM